MAHTYYIDEIEPVEVKSPELKDSAKAYYLDEIEPYDAVAVPEPPKEKESSNPIYNYAKGFYTGVTSTLPEMIGQSMQAFHIAPETGKSLAEWAREGEDLTKEKGMFEQAGEMTPASVGPTAALMTAGRAISMIPHPYAKLVGLGVSGLAAVLPALMFGASQYQQTKETAEKRGVDPGSAPLITGTIETAGETLGNMALMRLLGPGAPFAKAGVKNLKGVVLPTLGRYVSELAFKTLPTEVLTEIGQQYGEAAVEKGYGIRPEANPLKEAIDVIGPTAIMTVVGGGGGRILQKHITNNYLNKLSNPEEDPQARKTIADSVTQLIKTEQKDPELAQKWQEYSDQQIQNGEPIDRNMVLTELTDTEASPVTEQSKRQEFVNQIKDRLEIGDVTIDDINNLKSQSDDMVLKSSLDKIVKDYQDITAPEGEDLGQDPLIALENFKAEIEGMDVETVLDLKNEFVKRYPHLEDQANEAIVNEQPKPKEPEAVEPQKVKFMVAQQDRTELKNWGYTDDQIDKMKPDEVQEILQGEKPKKEPEPKPIQAPAKEEKAPGTAQGEAVEGEKVSEANVRPDKDIAKDAGLFVDKPTSNESPKIELKKSGAAIIATAITKDGEVGRITASKTDGNNYEVAIAIVSPEYQRKGIATSLTNEIKNRVESLGGELGFAKDRTPKGQAFVESMKPTSPKEAKVEAPVHDYSNTQINLPSVTSSAIKDFGRKIPDKELYTEKDDDSYGRETEPHITVRYGLETSNPKDVEPAFKDLGPIKVTLGKVSIFETDNYDVVKVDVESPDLEKANKKVGETVELPGETFKEYKPHATIAYVKKGEGKKYIGDKSLEGNVAIVDSIFLSAKDGKMHEIKLKKETGLRKVEEKPTPTPEKTEVALKEEGVEKVETKKPAGKIYYTKEFKVKETGQTVKLKTEAHEAIKKIDDDIFYLRALRDCIG